MPIMENSKIQGSYVLRISLNEFTTSFAFASNDRCKILHPSAAFQPDIRLSSGETLNQSVLFIKDNIINIKRAKIVTYGAEDLRTGFDSLSYTNRASVLMLGIAAVGDLNPQNGSLVLNFDKFNEWIDFNYKYKAVDSSPDFFRFTVNTFSDLCIDDYNIQSSYIGQSFVPELVLDVDTSGVKPQYTLNPKEVI